MSRRKSITSSIFCQSLVQFHQRGDYRRLVVQNFFKAIGGAATARSFFCARRVNWAALSIHRTNLPTSRWDNFSARLKFSAPSAQSSQLARWSARNTQNYYIPRSPNTDNAFSNAKQPHASKPCVLNSSKFQNDKPSQTELLKLNYSR